MALGDPAPIIGTRSAPLAGLRILTVSQFGAGPFGTQMLADLGADVIKIEDPAVGGDVARYVPPFAGDADSPYFQSFNRGKRSLTLDLRHPDGQAVFRDLVRVSDAVFNNARGDLPAKLGLTYAALRDVNPRVVCCALTGFGTTGPRAGEPAYDYLIQGYAGYMSVTGEPDGPPGKCGVSIIDFAGGYAAMVGLMVGLFDAQRTGIGRDVDVSLLDTAVSMLSYFATWTLNHDWVAGRTPDSAHQTIVPAQNFPTRDGWIVVFCNKDKFWRDLVEIVGAPELARDPRFLTLADRLAHRDALVGLLRARFATRGTAEWLGLLRGRVPCAPVNDVRQALQDEQVLAREMLVDVEHPEFGRLRQVRSPIRTEGEIRDPMRAPRLGEHTDGILRELLSYSDSTIGRLRTQGVIA
jgi:crotonobetainyl-CoA:carnitine CoA-transferase CaiB-like acyl-CoA transferase